MDEPTIDYDEWHFGADARVSHYRLAKGDVIYHNGKYIVASLDRPIDRLHRAKIMLDSHHWAAQRYIDVRAMALSFLDIKTKRSYDGGEDVDIMRIYLDVHKALNKWQMALVDRICVQAMRENDYLWAAKIKANVQEAFDRLEMAIHEAETAQKKKSLATNVEL